MTMPTAAVAKTLSANIAARLQTITIANGYRTDIGKNVKRGKLKQTIDSIPCCFLIEGDEKLKDSSQTANMPARAKPALALLGQRYIMEAHLACDADNPNDAAHDAAIDIKTAMFSGDRTFGDIVINLNYAGKTIGRREDGVAVVPVYVQIDAWYSENLTAP